MAKQVMLTEEGLKKLEAELEVLKGEKELKSQKKSRLLVHMVTFLKTQNMMMQK